MKRLAGSGEIVFDEQESACIADLYANGHSLAEIGMAYSVSKHSIRRALGEMPVRPGKPEVFRDGEKLQIAQMYRDGMKIDDIAAHYCVSFGPIRRALVGMGEKIRNSGEVDTRLRHGAFDRLNPESEYWAGFLAGDGCVGAGQIEDFSTVNVVSNDIDIMEKFAAFLNTRSAIVARPNYYSLTVSSKRISSRLISLGITPRKSKTLKVSNEIRHSAHFWRGAIDADGCIYIGRDQRVSNISIILATGSIKFAEQFLEYVNTFAPGKTQVRQIVSGEHRNYQVRIGSRRAIEVISRLYTFAPRFIVLDRKYEKAMLALSLAGLF